MTSHVRELPANHTHVDRYQKPFSTTRSPSRHTSGETFSSGRIPLTYSSLCLSVIYSGTTKSTRPEVRSNARVDSELADPQAAWKFRKDITALDKGAKILVDGGTLTIIHSKCGRTSTHMAPYDTSNFKEHVGVCQANVDNGSPERSPRGRQAPFMRPTTSTPGRRAWLTCPGFGFEETVGKGYNSLVEHERKRVDHRIEVGSLLWVNPGEKSVVIAKTCLRTSPLLLEPGQPCDNCRKIVKLSGLRDVLRPKAPRPEAMRYSPYMNTDGGCGDEKATDVSPPCDLLYPTRTNSKGP